MLLSSRNCKRSCFRELLTQFGLRSLSPRDPRYRPRYDGGVLSRDSAYHQGTVWPWLMGPFITAYIKINGDSEPARLQAENWLSGIRDHLADAGLGTPAYQSPAAGADSSAATAGTSTHAATIRATP